MALREPVPPGECRQCWAHANDPDIHRNQDQSKDCPQCVAHMGGDHGGQIVPKEPSIWW
jgi:hypothetical protein